MTPDAKAETNPAAARPEPLQCQWMEGKRQCTARAATWTGSRWLCAFHFDAWMKWRRWDGKK